LNKDNSSVVNEDNSFVRMKSSGDKKTYKDEATEMRLSHVEYDTIPKLKAHGNRYDQEVKGGKLSSMDQ
jgi:hypothetical protein